MDSYICRLSNRKSNVSKIKRTSVDVLLLKFIRKFSPNDPFRLHLYLCSFGVETIIKGLRYWRPPAKVLCTWSQKYRRFPVMMIMQFEIVPLFSFFLKSTSKIELSIDLRASIEGQCSSVRLEQALLTW